MAEPNFQEGTVPFHAPGIETPCHTYFKILGDLASPSPRLVIVHGGPGAGHEYLLPFGSLWQRHGMPVVWYDQIGCASSTRLPQTAGDEAFWQESLFTAELDNLIRTLNLHKGPGFFLMGQSWGCRIAAAYAAMQPPGLQRLVLASGMASSRTWVQGMHLQCAQLPEDMQQAIHEAEQARNFDSARFRQAMGVFMRTFFCRAEPFPPQELLPSFKYTNEDRTVLDTTKGPSPLDFTGSFRDWTCIPRLPLINVPTLLYNGDFDTSHDVTVRPLFEKIPRVKWITFQNASHMCHLDTPELAEKIYRTVGEFLTQWERPERSQS